MKRLLTILTIIQWSMGVAGLLLGASDSETATLFEFFLVKMAGAICVLICVGLEKLKYSLRWARVAKWNYSKRNRRKEPKWPYAVSVKNKIKKAKPMYTA